MRGVLGAADGAQVGWAHTTTRSRSSLALQDMFALPLLLYLTNGERNIPGQC